MTESDFIQKWINDSVPETWRNTAAEVFWVRAYKMDEPTLREMSIDFIQAFESSPNMGLGFSSSLDVAIRVTAFEEILRKNKKPISIAKKAYDSGSYDKVTDNE